MEHKNWIITSVCVVFHAEGLVGIELYRAVATTSQKHVTKHFRVAKRTLCSMAAERKLL